MGSLVFDLGDRFAIRAQRGPLSDYEPQSGSVLKRRLLDAKICWDPANPDAGFIPRRKLIQIVNKDAVKEELSWKSLLQNMHLPRKDLASEAEKICGSGEPSFSLGGGQPVHHLGSEETPCSPSQLQPRQTLGAPQKSFRKIMAILVLIGKPSKIRRFLKEDISDADLPLYKLPVPNSTLRWELRSARGDPKKMIRCFHGWKHHALSEFERRQWTVLTAFFAPGGMSELGRGRHPRIIHHWVLGESVVLPFEYQDESSPPGGCGQVMKVTIHPDHHVFNLPSTKEPNVFAVKRLKSKRREDFDRETSMLKRLSGDYEHTHLIVLLATYQHRGSYHLIFPWAEADLVGYWEKFNPIPDRNPTTAQWLIRQCQGLADALATIHHFPTFSNDSLLAGTKNPTKQPPGPKSKVVDLDPVALRRRSICKVLFGVHGDIKPPNILWFPGVSGHPDDLGTLKITDFGTAEFTRDGTSSPSGGSPFYRAPEVDIPGAVLGPAYDIWALGCVFLEFVTWYLQGWNGVECFGRKRSTLDNHRTLRNIKTPTFFTMDKNTRPATPVVKREVTEVRISAQLQFLTLTNNASCQYIHLLRTDPFVHCAKFVEEFLDLIVNQILVADLSKGKRMAAGHLAEKFSAMLSNTDEYYWTMPR